MASRLFSAPFPTETQYGLNLFDQTPVNFSGAGGGWSGGGQLITTVPMPSILRVWTILGWGISIQGATTLIYESGVAPFASQLGKLYGGIVRDSGLQEGIPSPFTALPRDASHVDQLWDGTSDPPFPQAQSVTPFVPGAQSMLQHAAELPTPVEFAEGEKLQVGLWLTPMVGQNIRVSFFNASYTILYDPTT